MSLLRILSLLPLLAPLAQAQEPPAAPPAPAAPAPRPNPNANKVWKEPILLENAKGKELAQYYRELTGRRVLVTQAAIDADISFVQVVGDEPLTYAEAAELLRKAAVLEGFVFTPHPDDPNLDILTVVQGGPARPNNVQLDVYDRVEDLPQNDMVVTFIMTFDFIKPEQAEQIFIKMAGPFDGFRSIMTTPNASALVITDKASMIRSMVTLKESIDKAASVVATDFIQVENADATQVAEVINELLTLQQQAEQQSGAQRVNAPAPQGGAPQAGGVPQGQGGANGGAGVTVPVKVMADARTNRIFAMGRPVDLEFVKTLVAQFDISVDQKLFYTRKLRFLSVSEFMPVAQDALSRAFSGTGDGGGVSGGSAGQSNARPSNNQRNPRNNNDNNSFGGGGGTQQSASLSDPNVNTAPESLLVGRSQLIADNITNSITIQGPPSDRKIIEDLIEQLDVRPEQVMISTVIGQRTLNNSTELGLNYLVDGKDVRGGGGGGDFSVIGPPDVPVGTFPAFNPASLASSGMSVYGQVGDLSAYLRALSTKTDFTVLSRPSIFTTNNRKGLISSGERIAIPTEGGTSTGSFSSGTRIQYEDVVLKLEVIPLVNSKDEITMEIALFSDEQNGNQIIEGAGTNGGDLTVPRISTREIHTTVTVPNGETIVLGGLIVGRTNKDKTGIPILSDIPLVGGLFGTTTKGEDRSELLVFIQPSLVGEEMEGLSSLQQDMRARYRVDEATFDFAENRDPNAQDGEKKEDLNPTERRRSMGPRHR